MDAFRLSLYTSIVAMREAATNKKTRNGEVIASTKDIPLILLFSKAMQTNAIQGRMKYRIDLNIADTSFPAC